MERTTIESILNLATRATEDGTDSLERELSLVHNGFTLVVPSSLRKVEAGTTLVLASGVYPDMRIIAIKGENEQLLAVEDVSDGSKHHCTYFNVAAVDLATLELLMRPVS